MSREAPRVQWLDETTLRVNEHHRRLTIAFGKFCLGALPALLLLQAGAKAVVIVAAAVLGMAYALVWLVRAMRMEFVAGPDGITVRHTRTTRTLGWSEVDSFIDAFIPANQGGAQWALGVKTTDGSILVAEMTTNGKPQGREITVQALRAVAWRYGVGAQLTGEAGNNGNPTRAGWHPDPGGAPGERIWNGAMWGPVRRHPDPQGEGAFESWDPVGDPATAFELYTTEARAARKTRNRWVAITVVVTIIACVLWASENHKGGSFTFAAVTFAAAAFCVWRTWGLNKEAQALERIVSLARSPVPVAVGMQVGLVAPGSTSSPADADVTLPWTMGVVPTKRNRMAMWALVCSIAGFPTFGVAAIVGIILGFRSRRRLRSLGGARRDLKLATAAIVVGALCVLFFISVTVIGALTAPTGPSGSTIAHQALLSVSV